MNNSLTRIKFLCRDLTIFPITIIYLIIASFAVPHFFTVTNFSNILAQSADILIISSGMMMVVLNGGIDFSMASIMGLGSVVGAKVMNQTNGLLMNSPTAWLVGILIMLGIGVVVGILNGLAVSRLKMPSFMATMATYLIISGLALYIVNSQAISNLPNEFLYIGNGSIGPIPFSIVLAVVILVVMWLVLNRTVYGRYVYAVGTNPRAALISGIPVKKIVFSLFLFSGTLAAIGGLVSSSRLGAAMPALNQDRLMDFVAAVILGGTSVFGGKGKLVGTIIGAFFIVILNNSLGLIGLSWYSILMIKGIFLIVIILIDSLTSKKMD